MITFKKIRWRNFLSTGNVFTEIDLTKNKTNLIVGKNGAGKSTILDALTFSLFGKPYRKINKPMLINSINNSDCIAETEFDIGNNQFKIVRGIKPAVFEIWQNGVMLDQNSSSIDQQKQLEQNILKMNYKSFTQIVVLGSSNFVPFMRLPVASRREIIEDILDIQIFSVMNVNLKEKLKFANDDIKERDYQLDMLSEKIEMQKAFISDIEKKNENEIEGKKEKIDEFREEQRSHDIVVLQHSQKMEDLTEECKQYQDAASRLKKLTTLKGKIQQKFSTHQKDHQFFSENESCPTCGQHIDDELKQEKISKIMGSITELNKGFDEIKETIEEEEARQSKFVNLQSEINDYNAKINFARTTNDRIEKQIKQLQKEIANLQNQSGTESEAYAKLDEYEQEQANLKKQLSIVKEERECLQTAAILLKDNGIKTRIIKRYLPVMNKLVNEYLQNMDFYVNFTLDENFEETIKSRYRDIFSYESFSEGEKARIDISLLLTWRAVAKLKNSVDTNLLILDEIFDGSLDNNGSSELGWILRNFDTNTNVFVISHKEGMEDKFHSTWHCEKVKNFSYVKETTFELAQEG